ncbi:ubiquitin carboxyl-terminal hydrolase 2-like [Melanotaenia boesemani]|uniref:ubiquitin carboxyl-terminal hydrolase 2-like n=1 Tax=Melanotaenia boesemani TaxID=1250792 RepID=UPI001C046EA7|nr:ubiquitin carboxyl-terminal hydrolase 2-like [Melanotaenia boesemani]
MGTEDKMKAQALSVRECNWTSDECHLVDGLHGDTQRDSLCLPNIFKSKKVRLISKTQTSFTYQVYHTARELLLKVLDRESVWELIRRAHVLKARTHRPSHNQRREQRANLSEEEYNEALKWFSIVLQSGLSVGENCNFGSELSFKLDRWHGVLKRNSIQTNLVSLTKLEDGDKLEVLSAFCTHLSRRYQALHTPGSNLAVKKYRLFHQHSLCSLHLALLCDMSSGFICNMYLFCPEQLQKLSRKPVVEQSQGSGRHLTEFTRALASELAAETTYCGRTVPVLPRLNSCSYQKTGLTNLSEHRKNTSSCGQVMENDKNSCSSAVKLETRWNRPGVCGLDNSGNSCYLNAVLQCLCSTVPLVEHLLNQDTRKELSKSKCRFAEVFALLLEKMWLGSSSSCAAMEARSMVCSTLPQFNNYAQQDAQELLIFLLNALHDDFKKVAKHQMRSLLQQSKQEQKRDFATESNIVSHLFEGHLSYMSLCMHCDNQAHNTQTFTVLSLPIPKDTNKCSIQDCLSLFFEQTILTEGEQMLCSVCELRRETVIFTCLEKHPEILILHLKRFGCKGKNQVKLRTNVIFSMKLDLTPFLSSSAQNITSSSYHLYAVVNHSGNLNTGHYTAVCYNALTQRWHCFDDEVFREVQDSLVQSPNAYMLLYSRKPFQKPKIHGL